MLFIYPVRRGRDHENLRYALRTLCAHVDGTPDVLIIGARPDWYTGWHIRNATRGNSFTKVQGAWRIAANQAEEFTWMNDDFFFTGSPKPGEFRKPRMMLSDAQQQLARRDSRALWRLQGAIKTVEAIPDRMVAFWWESHTPLKVSSGDVRTVLRAMDNQRLTGRDVAIRTAVASAAGHTMADNRVLRSDPKIHTGAGRSWPTPFLSTSPAAWRGEAGAEIRRVYTQASRWENVSIASTHRRRSAVGSNSAERSSAFSAATA